MRYFRRFISISAPTARYTSCWRRTPGYSVGTAAQFLLGLSREVRRSHQPLVEALRLVVDLTYPGTHPALVNEFYSRQEIIQEGTQGAVDPCEGLVFPGSVEPAIPHIVLDTGKIFLFDETVVIFLIGPGSGEGGNRTRTGGCG
jgi:hypothetical protein